jgi:outer membrane protein X
MQRILCLVAVAAASLFELASAHAQARSYEPIRVDSGLIGSYVSASGRAGFGGVVEPKFNVHDNIAVGARFEGAIMFGGEIGPDSGTKVQLGVVAAGLIKGEYLVGTSAVRPFIGFGLGVFDMISQSVEAGPGTAGVDQRAGRYFGIAPQLGINLGRLRLAATYNMILGADIEVRQMVGNVEQSTTYSQNYLSFEMSFRFGGRKKPHAPPPHKVAPPPSAAPPPAAAPPA